MRSKRNLLRLNGFDPQTLLDGFGTNRWIFPTVAAA
jgi:hypothetical protein